MMHNVFVSSVRRRARERDRLPAVARVTALMPSSDPELSVRLLEVQDAMERLPARYKELVLKIGLQEMAYADVVADLGIALGTVWHELVSICVSRRTSKDPSQVEWISDQLANDGVRMSSLRLSIAGLVRPR
jgi:Sigma-70, region 4